MRSRRSLSTVGLLVLMVLAGCMVTAPGGPPTPTSSAGPPTAGGGNAPHEFPAWDPPNQTRFANLSIGSEADLPDGEASHEYLVWNTAPADRAIVLTVWRGNTVIRNESVSFPADGVLLLRIHDPGSYWVVIAPAGGGRLVTGPQAFDCNHRSWEIAVHPDGTIDSRVLQTLMACATETG